MKKILTGLAVSGAVAGVIIFLLLSNLNEIVKGTLENVGSELLGVPVTVASVDIKLKSGRGQISGLTIANPAGFSKENAFQMDDITLSINLRSLKKQPLLINELSIIRPVVHLEAKADTSSNLQTLLDNIHSNSEKADKKAAEEQQDTKTTPAGEPIKIAFGKLVISGVTVHADVAGQKPQTVVIPDISRENVGKDHGLTPGKIGELILGDIITKAIETALVKTLTNKVEDTVKGFFNKLNSQLKSDDNK
jgi:Flp pilus assembly pilin Flp